MSIPCQKCKQSPATVHVTDIVPPNGEKRERHLCEECAEGDGITMKQHEPFNSVLAKFVQQKVGPELDEMASTTCPSCGITFREFRAQGQLGCPQDYAVFSKFLVPLLERAHDGLTRHVGKVPVHLAADVEDGSHSELAELQRRLDSAVECEDYESAAGLRDTMKKIQTHAD